MSTNTRLGRRGSTTILCSVGAAIALVLTGCASDTESGAADTQAGSVPARLDPALYQKAIDEAKSIAGDQQLGGSIEFIGVNGGAEGDVLKGVYKAFTDATGTTVNYTGSQDIISIVQSRVQAGNPPDVVDQTIGVADQYAKQGKLMNLSEVVGQDALTKAFGESLVDGVSNDGKVFGIYQGFNNFMVWYNPQTYKGPTDPKSWDELDRLHRPTGRPRHAGLVHGRGGRRSQWIPGCSVHREPLRQEVRARIAAPVGHRGTSVDQPAGQGRIRTVRRHRHQ